MWRKGGTIKKMLKKKSWLVQRLLPPRTAPGKFAELSAGFAFGGGKKNGGLDDNTFALLKTVFSFDYMGAAEFEHGAVPEALANVIARPFTAFAFVLTPQDVVEPDAFDFPKTGVPTQLAKSVVYVICAPGDEADVEDRIRDFAKWRFPQLKESPQLGQVLWGVEHANPVGWMELDNGYFFFTDQTMWENSVKALEILQTAK